MKTARPESGSGQDVFTKLLTIAAVIASSMSVYLFADHIVREAAIQRFAVRAEQAVGALREQMADTHLLVRSLAGLFASSEVVERREFRAFVASLRPARVVQALAWVPKLSATERSVFEDQARETGLYNFRLTEHSPDGTVLTAGERNEYFPIYFVEPRTGNQALLGFDLASDPVSLKALVRARDTGQLVATGGLAWGQDIGTRKEILIVTPVYQKEAPLRHIENRRQALAGFVLGVIRMGGLVDQAISTEDFHTTVIDASSDGNGAILFSNHDHQADGENLVHKESLTVSGRRWTVLIHPASPVSRSWVPLMAVVTWLGLLAGISAFVGLLTYRKANQELKEVNAKLESLNREKALILNSAGEGIYGLDQDGRITFANPKACDLIGCTLAEVIGRPQHEFFCQDRSAGPPGRDPIQATIRDGRMRQVDDERFRRRDGSTIPVEYRSSPVVGTHGQIEGAVVVFNDSAPSICPVSRSWVPLMAVVTWLGLLAGISAFVGLLTYRKANQELKEVNAKLESLNREKALILNSAGEGIYGLDQDGRITFANPKACDLIGCTLAEVIGRPQHEFFCQDRSAGPPGRDPIQATIRDGRMRQVDDERFRRRDGSTIPVEYRSSPVVGTHGQIEGAVVVFNDITARKRMAARQEEDARRLRQSNQELERFAYIASHDLQEPLRKMSSFCTILKEDHGDKLDHEAHDILDVITDAATRMQRLVQDLLAFSRLNGQQCLTMQPLPSAALADQGIDACAAMIEETGGRVDLGDLPVVLGNENLLVRVFQNLIVNSLKYRSDQPPRIRIEAEPLDGHWQFSVSDNGIGIESRHAERIFGFFERLRDKPECDGTGIGLAVCKRIVEQHGGRIWLDTSYTGGARFCFTLPASQDANGAVISGDVHDRDHAQYHAH